MRRWNLKTRAKAGRYLLNWQDRLTQGAHNLYASGYEAGLHEMSPPPPTELVPSNAQSNVVDRSESGGSLSPYELISHEWPIANKTTPTNWHIDVDKDSHL